MENFSEYILDFLQKDYVQRLLILLASGLVILLLFRYLKKLLLKYTTDTDQKYKTRKALNFIGYFLIIVVALFVYSDKLGNIGVTIGLVGAGITFALQEVITSIAGWFSIQFTNNIKIGKRVQIGEIKGDIIDISFLKTTIMEVGDWIDGDLYNGKITSISNSFVFKDPIQNCSSDFPFLWDEITIPIRTESDFKRAGSIF